MPSGFVLPPPVNPDDPGIGPAILAVSWLLTVMVMAAVGLRFYLRKSQKIMVASDDWIMLAATFFQIVYQIILTICCVAGLGKAIANMTLDQIIAAQKWAFLTTPFSNVVSILARISITILLIRIFGNRKWFKWFLISFTAFQTVLGLINIIIIWVQCTPVEAVWDFLVVGAKCWDKRIQQYLTLVLQALFGISDLLYVFFPVVFIWKLHMPTRRKIGLIVLMGFSVLTAVAALSKVVVNCVYANIDPFTDPQVFTLFGIMSLCTAIEQCLVIIIGSIPTLRPLANVLAPFFENLGTSLGSLVPSTWRRSSRRHRSETTSQSLSYKQGYMDLEMQPAHGVSGEELILPKQNTTVQTGPAPRFPPGKPVVQRTDDISVTYHKREP